MQLSKTQITFPQFFPAFSKSRIDFQHFEKKMTFIYFVFSMLLAPKS